MRSFLISAGDESEWRTLHRSRLAIQKEPWNPLNRKWVGPRASRFSLVRDEPKKPNAG